jgi:NADPH2:quinone reductase
VRAAVLHEHGAAPRCGEFADPEAGAGEVLVDVDAAAIHHLDLLKASGTFYMGPPPLPSVVGTDGVGRTQDGRKVFFDVTVSPYGSMAERCPVPEEALIDVPEPLDPVAAAALGNTGLGGWLAVTWRSGLQPGETVLVLGATGAVGAIATQAAKLHGAGRVIAAALADERLPGLRGADVTIALDEVDDLAEAIREASGGGVDVTIDTLWDEPALAAMQASNRFARHVEVGQLAGTEIELSAPAIRSISLDIRGFSVAHPPIEMRREAFAQLCHHVGTGEIVPDVERVPLEDVHAAWERQRSAAGGPKLVLVP